MNARYRQFYGRDDLRFLSICGDNGTEDADLSDLTPEAAAKAYATKSRIRYPALFDTPARRLTAGFFDQSFPNFFLLNGDGTVVASWNSAGGYEQFLAKLRPRRTSV
jgi:hypothetical protein